jgi:hypothetical protein
MNLSNRINAFAKLGQQLESLNNGNAEELSQNDFNDILIKAEQHNPWFTQKYLHFAFENIIKMLDRTALESWMNNYSEFKFEDSNIRVGVIMAGNIPLVGFHDFLSVLISGKVFLGKLSSNDQFLLPYISDMLINIEKGFENKIHFAEHLMKDFDAVIATGSNNSSRYFDYYFGKYPHIIRSNRNSVAVLTGKETDEQLEALGKDIFYYFGLGCRSVSKLMLPLGYDIPHLLDNLEKYNFVREHTKYLNNYEYNKSLLLINKEPHFDNGFLILRENGALASPISVINYEYYYDIDVEIRRSSMNNDDIQCVLSELNEIKNVVSLGVSQSPNLMEYADNVDVISFLEGLVE